MSSYDDIPRQDQPGPEWISCRTGARVDPRPAPMIRLGPCIPIAIRPGAWIREGSGWLSALGGAPEAPPEGGSGSESGCDSR